MNNKKFIVWEIIFPLSIAFFIYLLFRPVDTVVFRIAKFLWLEQFLIFVRSIFSIFEIPSWIIYSLPGGLWLLAFQNTISYLKCFSMKQLLLPILFAFGIGVGLEVLQSLNITDGRFDWIDILFYTIATITCLFTTVLINNKWQFYSREKSPTKLTGFFYFFFILIIFLADII
jgi:hypothetical protein